LYQSPHPPKKTASFFFKSNKVLYNQILKDEKWFDVISCAVEEWNGTEICKKKSRKLDIYATENKQYAGLEKPHPVEITLKLLKLAKVENYKVREVAEKRIQEILRARGGMTSNPLTSQERKLYDYIVGILPLLSHSLK